MTKTEKFYSKLFNWKVNVFPDKNYAFFTDGIISGGFEPSYKPAEEGINLVIAVDDINQKLEEIAAAGGKIVHWKKEIEGGHGFVGTFKDPNGNRLSLWSKA